ncbi:hypothetical protein C8R44DRAFT_819523 [Mycena epipterygia]|nr:hypothetical protein C8R44DRAFT_819523 [Mycena epipterygia]
MFYAFCFPLACSLSLEIWYTLQIPVPRVVASAELLWYLIELPISLESPTASVNCMAIALSACCLRIDDSNPRPGPVNYGRKLAGPLLALPAPLHIRLDLHPLL